MPVGFFSITRAISDPITMGFSRFSPPSADVPCLPDCRTSPVSLQVFVKILVCGVSLKDGFENHLKRGTQSEKGQALFDSWRFIIIFFSSTVRFMRIHDSFCSFTVFVKQQV